MRGNTVAVTGPVKALPVILLQLWRYGLVGLLCTALGLAVILICHEWLGLGIVLSNVVGYSVGLVISFLLNGRWTFQYRGEMGQRVLGFVVVVAIAFAANISVVFLAMGAGFAFFWAQLCGVTTYSGIVFMGGRLVFDNERRGRG